jgi:hypothetical protein
MTKNLFITLINRLPSEVVDALKATDQDSKYHAEGNVYIHTKMVFDEVVKSSSNADLMIAAIFHDLGKIDTHKKWVDKTGRARISHIGHEKVSLKYIDKYIHLYDDIVTDVELIKTVVGQHMRAHLYLDGSLKKPAKRAAFEDNMYFSKIIEFSKCDDKGRKTI